MINNIGLYYLFIEFQDEAWVKLAALYWDKLGRIVLPEYKLRDSDTVQKLIGELDFIKNFKPSDNELNSVSSRYLALLTQHHKELTKYYRVPSAKKKEKAERLAQLSKLTYQEIPSKIDSGEVSFDDFCMWLSTKSFEEMKLITASEPFVRANKLFVRASSQLWMSVPRLADLMEAPPDQRASAQLAYIFHSGRMTTELKKALVDTGLAEPQKFASSLIGIHPTLAFIYMETLAEEMAASRQFHLVTEGMLDHLAVSGCSMERIAQALLKDDGIKEEIFIPDSKLTEHEVEVQMASVALRSVIPRDIRNVPIEKIITFRKQYNDELAAFQAYLHEFVTNLKELRDIHDSEALQAHLEVEYEKKIKSQLDELKKCLESLGMDVVTGAMNIRVALPPIVVSGSVYLSQAHLGSINPILVGAGALAFSVLPVIQEKGKEARDKMHLSPAAYLLRVEEGLEPTKLTTWIARRARRFLFHL